MEFIGKGNTDGKVRVMAESNETPCRLESEQGGGFPRNRVTEKAEYAAKDQINVKGTLMN
jgi:hypothetical protein